MNNLTAIKSFKWVRNWRQQTIRQQVGNWQRLRTWQRLKAWKRQRNSQPTKKMTTNRNQTTPMNPSTTKKLTTTEHLTANKKLATAESDVQETHNSKAPHIQPVSTRQQLCIRTWSAKRKRRSQRRVTWSPTTSTAVYLLRAVFSSIDSDASCSAPRESQTLPLVAGGMTLLFVADAVLIGGVAAVSVDIAAVTAV